MDSHSIAFDDDVAQTGAYRYTAGGPVSARMANERYTAMILACTTFKGKTVVDVGCGDGTFTAHLYERSGAKSILGIEPAPLAVKRAAETYAGSAPGLQFECAASDRLLADGRRFDIAVYRGVIHHVADPAEEIQRAFKLAPHVIILEPNGCNPLMKAVEKISPYHRSHQERSFTPNRLRRWVRAAGGGVRAVALFGLVPYFCPAWIARAGRLLEPIAESLPGLRALICGQYIMTAEAGTPPGSVAP